MMGLMPQPQQPPAADPLSAEGQAQRLEQAAQQIDALLRRPDVAARVRAAGPDEWSAVQVIGHVIELVSYWLGQIQILADATGEPPHFGRGLDDSDRLEAVARGAATDPAALLAQLHDTLRAGAAAIRAMTPAQRARHGVHSRRGDETVAEFIEALVVSHVEGHLAQIQQVLGAAA
jgi:hypothetical protein